MTNRKYKLRYLPVFEQDLVQTVSYITNVLKIRMRLKSLRMTIIFAEQKKPRSCNSEVFSILLFQIISVNPLSESQIPDKFLPESSH